jgi:hypothetical protein
MCEEACSKRAPLISKRRFLVLYPAELVKAPLDNATDSVNRQVRFSMSLQHSLVLENKTRRADPERRHDAKQFAPPEANLAVTTLPNLLFPAQPIQTALLQIWAIDPAV